MLDRSSRSLPRVAGHGYEQVGRGEQQRHRQSGGPPAVSQTGRVIAVASFPVEPVQAVGRGGPAFLVTRQQTTRPSAR
jgi:hypothetical protein